MKFKIFILFFLLSSCVSNGVSNKKSNFIPYSSKGFALIYNEEDYNQKIVSSRLNSDKLEVGHNKLNRNSIIVITNPENKKSITMLVSKKVKYPNFYKVLITEGIAKKLELNNELPFIDIQQKIKNKSFVAKKAVTHSEEKIASDKAPVTDIKITNISTVKNSKKLKKKYLIIIGNFYSKSSADALIGLLINEDVSEEVFKVKKLSKNKYRLTAGPYGSINTLKNDYFKLNKYGFDDLDIKLYE